MREKLDPETIKRILMNPWAYMGGDHYNYDQILEQEEKLKRERHEEQLIDDEDEWEENFDAKDSLDDNEIQVEELVEPLEEQCKG